MQILDSLVAGALELPNEREADELIGMMVRYLATGAEPHPRTAVQRMSMTQVLPVLEKTRAKSLSGATGGRKSRKQNGKQSDKRNSKRTVSKAIGETVTEEEEEERSKTLTGFTESPPASPGSVPRGFTPPDADEVRAYFAANCLTGDPDAFYDHYAALGWRQNGRDVYEWEPLARQWHRRQRGFDAEARARGRQTDADAAEVAVWRPAETDEQALERIDAELKALGGAA